MNLSFLRKKKNIVKSGVFSTNEIPQIRRDSTRIFKARDTCCCCISRSVVRGFTFLDESPPFVRLINEMSRNRVKRAVIETTDVAIVLTASSGSDVVRPLFRSTAYYSVS